MELVPGCGDKIRMSTNAMNCWINLLDSWDEVDELVRDQIMNYAKWCYTQGGDVTSAVGCAFIEHVVESKKNWKTFKRYFSNDDIKNLKYLWDYRFKGESDKFIIDITRSTGSN